MVYVDLNPIRTQMAKTPEESDFTSIKVRINQTFDLASAIKSQAKMEELKHFNLPLKPLAKFEGYLTNQEQLGILFDAKDYLELVDTTDSSCASCARLISASMHVAVLFATIKKEALINACRQY